MKFLAAMMLVIFLLPAANAMLINSTSNNVLLVVDSAGGFVNSTNNRAVMTVDQALGLSNSSSNSVCIGFVCVEISATGAVTVTFLIETNVSGTSSDTAFVSVDNGTGLYRSADITQFTTCLQDTSLAGSPALGIVFAGSGFEYIRLDNGASFTMRLAQAQSSNKFVIPVTSGGCSTISNNYPITFPITPFVATSDVINAIELLIEYPVNLVGSFERTGSFTLVLERNNSEIIGRPL